MGRVFEGVLSPQGQAGNILRRVHMARIRCPVGILWYVESTGLGELFVWVRDDGQRRMHRCPAGEGSRERASNRSEKGPRGERQVELFTRLFGTWGFSGLWDFGSMDP